MFSAARASIDGGRMPHIVFFFADDWGHNDVGYNNPVVLTPNMDRLAANGGVVLEQNYVQPMCTPTRSALLTGMYPYHVGRQGYVFGDGALSGLTLDRVLLPEILRDLGYSTHLVGKWHLGHCHRSYLPTNRGFDTQYGFWTGAEYNYNKSHTFDPFPYDFHQDDHLLKNEHVINTYSGDLYRERMTSLIESHDFSNASNPLFLLASPPLPHFPVETPAEYHGLYSEDDVHDPERRAYLEMVTAMDDLVGSVVDDLKAAGAYDDSILVLMGDNGALEGHFEGRPDLFGGGSNDPFRGVKDTVYEGGIRTPAFVHSPLLKKAGYASQRMIHITDWFPTLLRAAGMTAEDIERAAGSDLDGIDQYEAVFGDDPDSVPEARTEFVCNLEENEFGVVFGAVRSGRWKLVNADHHEYDFELYDIEADKEESLDLAEDEPEILAWMIQKYENFASSMVPADSPPPAPDDIIQDEDGNLKTDYCDLDGTPVDQDAAVGGSSSSPPAVIPMLFALLLKDKL